MSTASPHVLVTAASRHGATAEIAEHLARCLQESAAGRSCGLVAVSVPVERQPDPTRYDAVVLASGVYVGRWLEPARHYAAEHAAALRTRPVWLLSSGPIGDPPFPGDDPHDAGPLQVLVGARAHRVFAGRLDRQLLGFGERAMVAALRAPVGDFRDWDALGAWAGEIAGELAVLALGAPPVPVTSPG
ncbi:protoporphyrinogen oxidase [Modestobacter muralis]|uniref:Protoporphyrinogen oxidase n=1 Tax=Modestobacter muralis TaxID=1608614 RepID=A0A6P0EUB8_9ACTN|nr:flavodoxin domain-containing protein [Modestobacter muralis]NEK95301.1 protoporphyrinogen oxidase [Modestobacter muralis]NEN52189.1 protoporphyrinogen oxidase [Modestobacter muralis]